jgi:hypothetical protein
MKKIIVLLAMVLLAVALIPGLSSAQQLVGPTKFSWTPDSGHGEDGGQKSYDVEYSSCRALTTDPNVSVISVKFIYTDWGRQVFQKSNVSYVVESKSVNLATGASRTYRVEEFYLSGGSSLVTNTANFDQWIYPRQGSAGQHFVDLARQLPNCTEY